MSTCRLNCCRIHEHQTMPTLSEQIVIQETVENELKQTVPSQPIYERFGGNIFFPVSRTNALIQCEEKLVRLRKNSSELETDKD
ncbi:unnamed protein product [Schistosoma guineensis]|nr:unnamed protein product [Schistosoma guineensis]